MKASTLQFYITTLLFLPLFFAALPASGQSPPSIQTTVCVLDLGDESPLLDATVQAQAENSDEQERVTGADGCVTLTIPVAVSNEDRPDLPNSFVAGAPYPNPGTGRISIPFDVDAAQTVMFQLYDLQGRAATQVFSVDATAGRHQLDVNLGNLAPGVYAFRMQGRSGVETGTVVKIPGSLSSQEPGATISSRAGGFDSLFGISTASRVRIRVSKDGYSTLATDLNVEDGERIQLYLQRIGDTGSNNAPELQTFSDVSIGIGQSLSFDISASDPDGDALTLEASMTPIGVPTGSNEPFAFTDNGDGTGLLVLQPQAGHEGMWTATLRASDAEFTTERSFKVTVTSEPANMLPVIAALSDQTMLEGESITMNVSATDADGDPITLAAEVVREAGGDARSRLYSFTDLGNGTGTLLLTPEQGDADTYIVTITADDTQGSSTESFTLTVNFSGSNAPPVVAFIDNQSVAEGGTLSVSVSATDADDDPISLSASIEDSGGTPVGSGFFDFTDEGNGEGTLVVTPGNGQAGVYTATVNAEDGNASDSESFTITVTSGGGSGAMIPLTDMGAQTYKGFSGGLYPKASNSMPSTHHTAGVNFANSIEPLDTSGNPSSNGKYVMISLGMSNTTQEFCSRDTELPCDPWTFMGQAADDPEVNTSHLVIVNGAKGGEAADEWELATDKNYNRIENQKLTPQGLSEAQVQIAWVKVANRMPTVGLPSAGADAFRLKGQLGNIVRALKTRYPNMKQVFFTSRIYAGYATTTLNPEPYAYESGFGVKWLVEAQIDQMDGGGVDDQAGDLDYNGTGAWAAWGAYPWADGMNPRSDGLIWEPQDLESDGTHPSTFGEEKVGTLLLDFFKNSPHTKCWFLENGTCE